MSGYILSILGIILAGIFIDILVPTGSVSKYIKSIYSIFVVAVILSPVVKFLTKKDVYTLKYEDYQINEKLMNFIYNGRADELKAKIEKRLDEEGFKNIDIKINYSSNNNEFQLNSIKVNLKNLVIQADKQHINKYEFISDVIKEFTNLTDEVILFYE